MLIRIITVKMSCGNLKKVHCSFISQVFVAMQCCWLPNNQMHLQISTLYSPIQTTPDVRDCSSLSTVALKKPVIPYYSNVTQVESLHIRYFRMLEMFRMDLTSWFYTE